jgi:hypothetical protein
MWKDMMPDKYLCRLLFVAALAVPSVLTAESVDFNRDIRPILADRCFHCHGPDEEERKGHLRLDVADGKDGAFRVHDGIAALKPKDLDASEVWHRIVTDDPDEVMPPPESKKKPLTATEKAAFKQWILDGAKYQDFWAFVRPTIKPPTKAGNRTWRKGAIDDYILAELESKKMKPSPEADKRTLIRRVYFDLTGLPPTPAEIEMFVNDNSRDAYEKLVDRLIASPGYGEHRARYWADLVRLADSNGMHKDFFRDFSTYRDWLIRAYNENLPFDQFISYQLAGDLYDEPSNDQLVASGFNRLHLIIDRGTALPEESLHKNVLDRVQAFGTAFMGMTVQCGQCHEHKYDPISQKEFYQLYAFFNNFSGPPETAGRERRGLQPPLINLTTPEQDTEIAKLQAQEAEISEQLKTLQAEAAKSELRKRFGKPASPWIWDVKGKAKAAEFRTTFLLDQEPAWAALRFSADQPAEVWINDKLVGRSLSLDNGLMLDPSAHLKVGENSIRAKVKKNRQPGFALELKAEVGGDVVELEASDTWEARGEREKAWQTAKVLHQAEHWGHWGDRCRTADYLAASQEAGKLKKQREAVVNSAPGAMVMSERADPRPTHILVRGAYDNPGERVERNTPAFLPPMKPKDGMYDRLDLAQWVVDPAHPLTARVTVNRIWQQFFGVGLVKTAEDFGAMGEWPSHPQLLDYLAVRFVESGWDLKELVREIVTSSTYRQRSDASADLYTTDPENRLLARGSRYRLDAEMIRDQLLMVSGVLNSTMFGQSVKPPQPPGLWKSVSMIGETFRADQGDKIYRRSIYTFWKRGMPPPQMTIMNAPSREYCVARRERTNTPLQALLMMNEPEYFKLARQCAERTLAATDGDADKAMLRLYESITSQTPSPDRQKLMKETLGGFKSLYTADRKLAAAMTPDLGKEGSDTQVDVAAWTMLTHSLLNLELAKVRR